MPTLYVENVPHDLYDALRKRAQESRSSISSEVLSLLRINVPTAKEMARRQQLMKRILRIQRPRKGAADVFPSAEETQREDRLR